MITPWMGWLVDTSAAVGPLLARIRSISRRMAPKTAVTNSNAGSGAVPSVADGPIPSSPRNFDTMPVSPVVVGVDCVAVLTSVDADRDESATASATGAPVPGASLRIASWEDSVRRDRP